MQIGLTIPKEGVELKLHGKYLMGTLTVTRDGILWAKSHSKSRSDRMLTWSCLNRVMLIGLFGQ